MDFPTAMAMLSQVHNNEVQSLRSRINALEAEAFPNSLDQVDVRVVEHKGAKTEYYESGCMEGEIIAVADSSIQYGQEQWDSYLRGEVSVVTGINGIAEVGINGKEEVGNGWRKMPLPDRLLEKKIPNQTSYIDAGSEGGLFLEDDEHDGEIKEFNDDDVIAAWLKVVTQMLEGGATIFTVRAGWSPPEEGSDESKLSMAVTDSKSVADFPDKEVASGNLPTRVGRHAVVAPSLLTDRAMLEKFESRYLAKFVVAKERRSLLASVTRLSSRKRSKGTRASHSRTTCVMHPTSKKRISWVLVCVLLLVYEIFLVTMMPFGFADSTWARQIDLYCATFWNLDIVVNFFSGVYVQGKAEMRFPVVAKLYIRGWFIFDTCIVVVQWLAIVSSEVAKVGTSAFIIKFLRFFRLLRLARMGSYMQVEELADWALERMEFQTLHHMLFGSKLMKFLFGAALFVHCVTCGWYQVGQTTDGWVSRYSGLLQEDAGHDYLVAMNWALSQIQGNIDIYPGPSTSERAFTCVSSIASIVFLAIFLSSLTELMVSVNEDRKRRYHEVHRMHSFLHRHSMPQALYERATHFVRVREREQEIKARQDRDEQALRLFPARMREQLRAELLSHELCILPVFSYLAHVHNSLFVDVCANAVTTKAFAPQDDVFLSQDSATHQYSIFEGEFVYNAKLTNFINSFWEGGLEVKPNNKLNNGNGSLQDLSELVDELSQSPFGFSERGRSRESNMSVQSMQSTVRFGSMSSDASETDMQDHFSVAKALSSKRCVVTKLRKGDFANEAALWMSFYHEGDLCCANYGQCFLLDADDLTRVVHARSSAFSNLARYARRFYTVTKKLHGHAHKYVELIDARTFLMEERMLIADASASGLL